MIMATTNPCERNQVCIWLDLRYSFTPLELQESRVRKDSEKRWSINRLQFNTLEDRKFEMLEMLI